MLSRIFSFGSSTEEPATAAEPSSPKPVKVGAWTKRDPTDEDVVEAAQFALEQINGPQKSMEYDRLRISKAYSQVVAGQNYQLTLWLSAKPPLILEVQFCVQVYRDPEGCFQLVSKRCGECTPPPTESVGIPGGWISHDPLDASIAAIAQFAVDAIQQRLGCEIGLTEVTKAQSQVVAGVKYRLTLQLVVNGRDETVFVTVFHDLKGQDHLVSWRMNPLVKRLGGWEDLNPEYAQIVEASAKFATHHLSVCTGIEYTYSFYSDAEQQVVSGMNFRYSLTALMEGDMARVFQVEVYWPLQEKSDPCAQVFHLVSIQQIV